MKVGIAARQMKRMSELQVAHYKILDIHAVYGAEDRDSAFEIEKRVHWLLKQEGLWLRGEWFRYSPDVAMSTIEMAAKDLGAPLNLRFDSTAERNVVRHRKLDAAIEDIELEAVLREPWDEPARGRSNAIR